MPHWKTHEEAARHYGYARERAFGLVRESLVSRGVLGPGFSIRGLDGHAVGAWEHTWRGTPHWSRQGGFAWIALHHRYCRKPRNFHCALWHRDVLCGLAVGRVSEGHEQVALHFMEGNPDPSHPLRGNVADVVFGCAQLYARSVGAKWLVLKEPDAGLELFYARLGFGLAYREKGVRYCKRAV
jgi:hypothetical protein